jgi:hypothetical protein
MVDGKRITGGQLPANAATAHCVPPNVKRNAFLVIKLGTSVARPWS